jgi:DoxX-like family
MANSRAVTKVGRVDGAPISKARLRLYWLATLYVVISSFAAGIIDILHAPPLSNILEHLGYPPHFGTMLGAWKVLGAVALMVPRYPLVKEWAYAGMFFDFIGAVVAHASAGDSVVWYIGPVVSIAALITSWFLRPDSRRLTGTSAVLRNGHEAGDRLLRG